MNSLLNFLKENKEVAITLIVASTVLIGYAMYMGLDVSWIQRVIFQLFSIQ